MDNRFTVAEHLEELRVRIILSLLALGIGTIISVPFAPFMLKALKLPAAGGIDKLAFFSPEEAFLVYMRISVTAGLVISMPVIAYQAWAFLSPAMGEDLKKKAFSFLLPALTAFAAGCLFSYSVILPNALKFLLGLAGEDLIPVISAVKYVSFTTNFILICGLLFQMPVVSFFMARIGLLEAAFLRRKFAPAAIVIFVIAAVITPTGDAFNMLILALPMLFLYEVSIWVARLARLSKRKDGDG
jgi:sec-independent protein translocase protein TatC